MIRLTVTALMEPQDVLDTFDITAEQLDAILTDDGTGNIPDGLDLKIMDAVVSAQTTWLGIDELSPEAVALKYEGYEV